MGAETYAQQAQQLADANVEIAVLKAQAVDRDRAIERIFAKMELLDAKLTKVTDTLSEAKGGWRVLMLFGGAGGAVGAGIAWFFSNVTLRGFS